MPGETSTGVSMEYKGKTMESWRKMMKMKSYFVESALSPACGF